MEIIRFVKGKWDYLDERMDVGTDVFGDFVDVLFGFTSIVLIGTADSFDFDHDWRGQIYTEIFFIF